MASHFQFIKPVGAAAFTPTHTLFVYEGPDWCLEELQNPAGTVLHCWSYEIVELERLADGTFVREIIPKPRDWVGSCLLRTLQLPCTLHKENEKGIWLQTASWDRLQWSSHDQAAAEAWRLLPAAAAAAASRPFAAVKPEREGNSNRGRGRGRGMGRGRGRGGAFAGNANTVCQIRLH